MLTRRVFVVASLLATFNTASAQAPSPNDPVAIITAIYSRAAKGEGDGGGDFIIANRAAKTRYLSKSLVALWPGLMRIRPRTMSAPSISIP